MSLKKRLQNKAEDVAVNSLNKLTLPNALLIIPDGNGRWAKSLGLTVYEGHKQGAQTFAKILDMFLKLNIKVLGAWGFSEDNWKRPQDEIEKIMDVIENVIKQNSQKMMDNNIKFLAIGNKERIKNAYPTLFTTIEETVNKTSQNTNKTLALFIDYGERFQLEEFAKARKNDQNTDTNSLLAKINDGLPLFDMVLRTSGELRLSGFGPLASLAEFVSVKKNLPELSKKDIADALIEFSGRQRRFGGRT